MRVARVVYFKGGGKSSKQAFTLMELLVVVVIIALLAAILMPSLVKAREQARSAVCLSNLKNIGLAFALYHNVSNDYYPTAYNYVDGARSSNGYYHWTAALSETTAERIRKRRNNTSVPRMPPTDGPRPTLRPGEFRIPRRDNHLRI